MLASLAVVIVAVVVVIPLIYIVGMSVMRLVKARFTHGLGHAFHAAKEQGGDYRYDDHAAHIRSLHISRDQVQSGFTFSRTQRPLGEMYLAGSTYFSPVRMWVGFRNIHPSPGARRRPISGAHSRATL